MKTNKKIVTVLTALIVAVIGGYLMIEKPLAKNDLLSLSPRSGDGSASSEYLNAERSAMRYRDEIQKNPGVLKNYIQLAQVFLQEGRVTGNNGEYIPKAKYLLSEVFKRDPENFEALITSASIAATLHQFNEAKQLTERAIARNPHNAFAYGVLCDAFVELGRYDEAVKACDKMMSIRPDLRSYARTSYIRELYGDVDGAMTAMKYAADAGVSGQENRAWVLYNLAMLYFNEGHLDTAEYIFTGILQERPNYAHALNGLARVKSHQQDYETAIKLYQKAIASLDESAFHESLGEVYQVMGDEINMRKSYDRAEVLYEKEKENGEDNALEMARFFALHDRNLSDALEMAKAGAQRRPSILGYETLALALYKNGVNTEAWDAICQAMRLGTRDASLYYLAGMIAGKNNNGTLATQYLQRALSINRNFSLIYAAEAERIVGHNNPIGS